MWGHGCAEAFVRWLVVSLVAVTAALSTGCRSVDARLGDAALNGDPQAVIALLAERPSDQAMASALVQASASALPPAVENGHVRVVQLLLDSGVDVNARNRLGNTALAAATRSPEVVRLLLTRGADVDARSASAWTPLHSAVAAGAEGSVRLLIEAGADMALATSHGETPLHIAAWFGSAAAAKQLLDAGADVDAVDDMGRTPLHLAAITGTRPVARLLIDAGADVTAGDREGVTALHWAVYYDERRMVRMLLDAEADHDIFTACGTGRLDLVEAMLAAEPGLLEAVSPVDGGTPLHWAVRGAGANMRSAPAWPPEIRDEPPISPQEQEQREKVVARLVELGAPLDARDDRGETPIDIACSQVVADLLIAHEEPR